MAVRREQYFHNGVYFIIFTCYKWLSLFDITDGYMLVYKWFDALALHGSHIIGYVIMPNHVHVIIGFKQHIQNINTRVGNGKRFIAYGLVGLLKQNKNDDILKILGAGVNNTDRKRGKNHHVFMASFDCKECRGHDFLMQKLNYIHANPCRGKWNLADVPENYRHSSASFYYGGELSTYKHITNFVMLNGIDLSKPS